MENRNLALSLLFLTVLVSGCADTSTDQAITVDGPSIQPTEIFEGSSVRISMGVQNTGEIEGQVFVGKKGQQVLTDYCPDFFDIENFDAHSSRKSETAEKYDLRPNERLQMNWELEQGGTEASVPLNGYSCPMKFQVPFNYSIQAYQQIQLKQDDETSSDVKLSSKSSKGPLKILVQVIGSSSERGSPVFLKGDNPEVLLQIINEEPEKSSYKGVIQIRDLEIESSGVEVENAENCRNYEDPIRLRRGKSLVLRCQITNPDGALGDSPSVRAEIRANADYTYVREVGSRTVEVKYSGNN